MMIRHCMLVILFVLPHCFMHGAARDSKFVEAQFSARRQASPSTLKLLFQDEQEISSEPDYSIVLHNANVPIERVWITERDGIIRSGIPRNPLNQLSWRSLWDLQVRLEGGPYVLSIMANGKKYQWKIISVGIQYGNELMLIQSEFSDKIVLKLQQYDEIAKGFISRLIPLISESDR